MATDRPVQRACGQRGAARRRPGFHVCPLALYAHRPIPSLALMGALTPAKRNDSFGQTPSMNRDVRKGVLTRPRPTSGGRRQAKGVSVNVSVFVRSHVERCPTDMLNVYRVPADQDGDPRDGTLPLQLDRRQEPGPANRCEISPLRASGRRKQAAGSPATAAPRELNDQLEVAIARLQWLTPGHRVLRECVQFGPDSPVACRGGRTTSSGQPVTLPTAPPVPGRGLRAPDPGALAASAFAAAGRKLPLRPGARAGRAVRRRRPARPG